MRHVGGKGRRREPTPLMGVLFFLFLYSHRVVEAHASWGPTPEAHAWAKVEGLATQITAARTHGQVPLALAPRKGSASYQLSGTNYKRNATLLSVTGHDRIVRVDPVRRVIHAEAGVTMETLVRAAREHGLVPKVVAPFRKATVGGSVRQQPLPRQTKGSS